ncbi:phycobiliprotein lyase [Brunnivagina elsteri]|uniref:Chromophore lyase CpcS/CpeS n=1 Tax=Brunnivagina elsteri CCALA 953 TaxID=987040 RepID=A0A2A2TGP1_9CYAN|nr:phycobiliprotein lyase [Calothrix elsteri]PAX52892.1 phycobiliprotein lyase [Calothrix elsteri CCALA 953]
MNITEFFELSLGRWRSQRSGHHLAFAHFEESLSTIDIVPLDCGDEAVIEVCKTNDINPQDITHPFRMTWEGESDWDDKALAGTTVLVSVPDLANPAQGKLLRDRGYAETVNAAGRYTFGDDGVFTLITGCDRAGAEERIWFANPNVRFRVATIKSSDGNGITTASFPSEIRSLSNS